MSRARLRLILLLLPLGLGASAAARDYVVTVAPSELDRAGQIVAFPLPKNAPKGAVVRTGAGTVLPLQVDADGTARFLVPQQKARETLQFTLSAGPAATTPAGVVVAPAGGDLGIKIGGRDLLGFRMARDVLPRADIKPELVRAGYVHPIFSPAGQLVTDDYPSNHPHHHGIWAPWTKTRFQGRAPDFWNMGGKTGAEDFVALDRTWSGPLHGGFEARLRMVDLSAPKPVTVLHVTWQLTAYDTTGVAPAARIFDLVITETCATADPLILPEYHYGGFGFRGADAWNGAGSAARFLTSEGITDRIKGNNTRARWCYLGGAGDKGALAGTTTLGHPDNFRSPQPVRLHPNMPYFSFVPQQLGEFKIEPGKPYVARFRFVVTDGAPDRARFDAFWNAYAHPATIKVSGL